MTDILDESESTPARPKRLSRQESKAKTRALLISTGRKHFLLHGFVGATSEDISEEAGFSRGALHSNFEDKEGLFMEVVRESHQRYGSIFAKLLRRSSGQTLLDKLRQALADIVKDPDFKLIVEFELEALRNEKLRKGYIAFHQDLVNNGLRMLEGISSSSDLRFAINPQYFVIAMMSCIRGIATYQMLLGSAAFPQEQSQQIIFAVFNCYVIASDIRTSKTPKRS